jgi:pilus assembly protein Flp/PilA
MKDLIKKLGRDERGGTAIEYGLIISLVVIAMIAALGNFAATTINMWNTVSEEVSGA